MSEYEKQAQGFLDNHGLKVSITYLDNKPPKWDEESYDHNHYIVRITRKSTRKSLTFQFWDSIANSEKGERPTPYDVLACISSDSYKYDSFQDFCGEVGYNTDSIKALETWKRYDSLSKRMNRFFSSEELEALREIR